MEGSKSPNFSSYIHTFFFSVFIYCICMPASSQTDTLSRAETLGGGRTLVSANNMFKLGFFRPGTSQESYLGIWMMDDKFHSVWVANRENPLPDSSSDSATLTIQEDGNLAVIDGLGKIFWSTNVSIASNTTMAQLLGYGNLVLKEGNSSDSGRYIWQIFHHPTHALLPGMTVGIDLTTKQTQMLKSWKNSDDPAPGNFEFGLDEGELKQFFIYRRSIPNRRAVFWNGSAYDDTSRWGFGWNAVNYSVIDSKTELYFTFHSPSATAMVVMTPEGYLDYIEAGANSLQTTNWIGERDLCSVSQGCSAYSICNVNRRPVCMCLPGFETIESGCKRKTDLHCGRDEGVLVLKGVEMPAFNGYARLKDEEKCRKYCFSGGCDCKGFAFINESKCGIQDDDLRDIREEEHGRLELVHNISIPVLASDLSKFFALPIFHIFFSPLASDELRFYGLLTISSNLLFHTTALW